MQRLAIRRGHKEEAQLTPNTGPLEEQKQRQTDGLHHGGSEKPGKLEVGGASRDSTGFGALEEGLISS